MLFMRLLAVLLVVAAALLAAGKPDDNNNKPGDNYVEKHGHDKPVARDTQGTFLVPMYQGFGSHYVFLYVGTPARRQALVVDTANHLTAFPCVPCKNCGRHVDPLWDPKKSTTANVLDKCPVSRPGSHNLNNKCVVGQSYTDGSSWEGYVVKDNVYLGGLSAKDTFMANRYDFNFSFICETQETEIFQKQLANGVLGLSRSIDTLPMMLRLKRVTNTPSFALCFRIGGGIMTIGGVDNRLHKGDVQWLKMADMVPMVVPGNNFNHPPIPIGPGGVKPVGPGGLPALPSKHEDFDDDDDDDDDDNNKNRGNRGNGDNKRSLRDGSRRLQPSDIFDTLPTMNGGAPVTNKPTPPPGMPTTHDLNHLSLYVVVLKEITIHSPTSRFASYDSIAQSYTYNSSSLNRERGCVIDSAASDIDVPTDMMHLIVEAFSKIAGITLSGAGEFTLDDPKKLFALPTFRFSFVAENGYDVVTVEVPYTTYVDQTEVPHTYAIRIRARNERGGVTLGAKFFLGHNVVFDMENRRIGLAESDCKYEDYVAIADGNGADDDDNEATRGKSQQKDPTADDDDGEPEEDKQNTRNGCRMHPKTACSAMCDRDEEMEYKATGSQTFENECDSNITEERPCSESCNGQMIVRGDPHCPDSPWRECNGKGRQKRHVAHRAPKATRMLAGKKGGRNQPGDDDIHDDNAKYQNGPGNQCNYETEERVCYTDMVPVRDGDYLIFIDMKFPILPQQWSYVHAEAFFRAFNQIFKVCLSSLCSLW
jgi:hypothetical protein